MTNSHSLQSIQAHGDSLSATPQTLKVAVAQADLVMADVQANHSKIVALAQQAQASGAQVLLLPELALSGCDVQQLVEHPGYLAQQQAALERLDDALAQIPDVIVVLGHLASLPETMAYSQVGAQSRCYVLPQGRAMVRPLALETIAVHATAHPTAISDVAMDATTDYPVAAHATCPPPFLGGAASANQGLYTSAFGLAIEYQGHVFHAILGSQLNAYLAQSRPQAQASPIHCLVLDATPYYQGRLNQLQTWLTSQVTQVKHVLGQGGTLMYCNQMGAQEQWLYEGRAFALTDELRCCGEVDQFIEAMAFYELAEQGLVAEVAPNCRYSSSEEVESELWRALVLYCQSFFKRSGIDKAILGLSGGMDSALVLAVLYDALGPERIMAVMMPSQYTSELSLALAQSMAQGLSVTYKTINIQPIQATCLTTLAPFFEGKAPDTTEENLQARIRGVLLMALSNKLGGVVVSGSNKSEAATGYSTLYGDTVGGFVLLKDVSKSMVFRLARWRNRQAPASAPIIPEGIIERPPSAELAPDQVDEQSLPPYEVLDEVLDRLMVLKQSHAEIVAAGFAPEDVERVRSLLKSNEYKRRQLPPGPRLSQSAFGLDWYKPLAYTYAYD